jgi:hypothetical protein
MKESPKKPYFFIVKEGLVAVFAAERGQSPQKSQKPAIILHKGDYFGDP